MKIIDFKSKKACGLSHRASGRAQRRGSALIEFAMIASLFVIMLLGMIQFGIYQSTSNTLWNLSREGARFASVSSPSDQAIKDYINKIVPPNINVDKLTIEITPDTKRISAQPVTIKLTYDMTSKIIFPIVTSYLKSSRTVKATPQKAEYNEDYYPYRTSSTMRVE